MSASHSLVLLALAVSCLGCSVKVTTTASGTHLEELEALERAQAARAKKIADLEGTWIVAEAKFEGQPNEKLVGGLYEFKGSRLTITKRKMAQPLEAELFSPPGKDTIDWMYLSVPLPATPAIYRRSGAFLEICFPTPGINDRPANFKSGPGSHSNVLRLVRSPLATPLAWQQPEAIEETVASAR